MSAPIDFSEVICEGLRSQGWAVVKRQDLARYEAVAKAAKALVDDAPIDLPEMEKIMLEDNLFDALERLEAKRP